MAVVINEFEVVADPAPAPVAAAAEPMDEIKAPPAFEIERIARFLEERALRLWAH